MILTLLILLHVILILWISWIRGIYFSRPPIIPHTYTENQFVIYSPAEGTVAYIKKAEDFVKKRKEIFKLRGLSENLEDYNQIGIFMSPYDNHHVVKMIGAELRNHRILGNSNPIKMSNYLDSLFLLFGKKFYNWIERSKEFLTKNQVHVFEWNDRYNTVYAISMDKYVGKIRYFETNWKEKNAYPKIIGFICRGSQTDIFIHKDYEIKVRINQRVTYGSIIAQR